MENIRDIANWFLSRESMPHKKLQKLCYYAQAWYCALYDGSPLFEDEIQAWVHGPVIPGLYVVYAKYNWSKIPNKNITAPTFNEEVTAVLEAVANTYSPLSGDQLECLTHSEDPWNEARGDLEPWKKCTTPISCASMREYYAEKYAQSQND